jgi:hypothetical protein
MLSSCFKEEELIASGIVPGSTPSCEIFTDRSHLNYDNVPVDYKNSLVWPSDQSENKTKQIQMVFFYCFFFCVKKFE